MKIDDVVFLKAKKIYNLPVPTSYKGLKTRAKQYSLKTTKMIKGKRYPKTHNELHKKLKTIKIDKTPEYIKSLIYNISIKFLSRFPYRFQQKHAIALQIADRLHTKI
tara:strand:- start:3255 stop:3575 length:321 start_codon:yes stop_codon:yes gene_type:complete